MSPAGRAARRAVITLAGLLAALNGAGCEAAVEPDTRLAAQGAEPTTADPVPAAPAPADPPAASAEGTARVFGTAPTGEIPLTPVSALLDDPESFRDQVVRTEGQIARVCQRMGCWMELREGDEGPAVRVPMAGHSFFLPRDVAGRHATLQGRVALRELSPAARAHLESEGAVATASALSIEASGVVID